MLFFEGWREKIIVDIVQYSHLLLTMIGPGTVNCSSGVYMCMCLSPTRFNDTFRMMMSLFL